MKTVIIGSNQYYYEQIGQVYRLYYSNSKTWASHVRGKTAFEVVDTGNGLIMPYQQQAKHLDYSEAAELKYLLSKIKA